MEDKIKKYKFKLSTVDKNNLNKIKLYNNKIQYYQNMIGGNNYSAPYKVYGENTASIYLELIIDKTSTIGQKINARKKYVEDNLPNDKSKLNLKIDPHISLLEIVYNSNTVLGEKITDSIIKQITEIATHDDLNIIEDIKNIFISNLKGKQFHSNQGEYEVLGNYIVRNYSDNLPLNNYKQFKMNIYSQFCNYFDIDIFSANKTELNIQNANTNNLKFHNFNYDNNLEYAISDYFYDKSWKPHISLIKIKDINNVANTLLIDNIKKEFKEGGQKSTVPGPISYINLWRKSEIKPIIINNNIQNIAGSLKCLKLILNHPDHEMYKYSIEILI
jgi:hypothetical protein